MMTFIFTVIGTFIGAIIAIIPWIINDWKHFKKTLRKMHRLKLTQFELEHQIECMNITSVLHEDRIGSLEKRNKDLEEWQSQTHGHSIDIDELKFQVSILKLINIKLNTYKFIYINPQEPWLNNEVKANYKSLGNAYVDQGTMDQKVYEIYYIDKTPEEME